MLGISISGSAQVNNPTCTPACGLGQLCVARVSSDRRSVYPVCKNIFTERNSGCTDVPLSPTGCQIGTQFCHFGLCVSCGSACALPAQLLSTLYGVGAAVPGLNATVSAQNSIVAGNRMRVRENALLTLSSSSVTLASNNSLQFGGDNSTGSNDDSTVAVAEVDVNVQIQFPNIIANVRAALAIAQGAFLRATRFVVNRFSSIALDARGSASVQFDNLSLSASLQINGPGVVVFPRSHANCTADNSNGQKKNVTMSGNVEFSGFAGNVDIVIQRSETDPGEGRVSNGNQFATKGNVQGNGNMNVSGEVSYENDNVAVSITVDADTTILNNGRVVVRNAGQHTMGNVTLLAGSTITLYNGARTFIRRLRSCPPGATIVANISASGTLANNKAGVIFAYDSNTYVQATAFRCNILIVDATGTVYTARNPNNNSSSTTTSRRLLQTTSTTEPQATWTENGLVYTYGQVGAASALQVTGSLMIALMVMAIVAMFN